MTGQNKATEPKDAEFRVEQMRVEKNKHGVWKGREEGEEKITG